MGQVEIYGRLYPIDCQSLNYDPAWDKGLTKPVDMSNHGNVKGEGLKTIDKRGPDDEDATILRFSGFHHYTQKKEHFHLVYRCNRTMGDASANASYLAQCLENHLTMEEIFNMFCPLVEAITRAAMCKKFWQGITCLSF